MYRYIYAVSQSVVKTLFSSLYPTDSPTRAYTPIPKHIDDGWSSGTLTPAVSRVPLYTSNSCPPLLLLLLRLTLQTHLPSSCGVARALYIAKGNNSSILRCAQCVCIHGRKERTEERRARLSGNRTVRDFLHQTLCRWSAAAMFR